MIELAFVRFKSTARNPAAPTVYLAGGPGGSDIGARFPLYLSSPRIKDVMLEFMKGYKISTTRIALESMKFAPINLQKTN